MGFARHSAASAAVTKTYKCRGGLEPGQREERAEAALSPADGSQPGLREGKGRSRLLGGHAY